MNETINLSIQKCQNGKKVKMKYQTAIKITFSRYLRTWGSDQDLILNKKKPTNYV